jgi:sugar-specific transcriptional regulator TrmB
MKKHISENLKKALLQLNLTEKEIATYLVLLEQGVLSIQDISKNTGINRVTIYAAIEELRSKGLVAESRKGKRKLFVAENPESLENILQEKRNKLKQEEKILQNIILPSLKAIDINQENKPQIKFFEGLEGIYKIYDDYILKSSDVISCGSYDSVIKVSPWKVEKEYIQELRKRKVLYRGILEDTETNHKFDGISKGVMHNKFLPIGEKVSADVLVFGSMVALISYKKKSATLIEDESIAESIRMYLNFMWDRLK